MLFRSEWGRHFDPEPGESVLARMSELVPREMRRAWTSAFGNARLDGRGRIEVADLPSAHASGSRAPIGFVRH